MRELRKRMASVQRSHRATRAQTALAARSVLSGNNSSRGLSVQVGSFSKVSVSQAIGSIPFRRAVSSSD